MVRMMIWILAHLRHPRKRKRVAAEQVMEVAQCRFHKPGIGAKRIRDQELHPVAACHAIGTPDIIFGPKADKIAVSFCVLADSLRRLKRAFANIADYECVETFP